MRRNKFWWPEDELWEIGHAIGCAAQQAFDKIEADKLVHRLGDYPVVLTSSYYYDDPQMGDSGVRTRTEQTTLRSIIERLAENSDPDSFQYINNLSDLGCYYGEMLDERIYIRTVEEHMKITKEDERKRLEVEAKKFAQETQTVIGTFDFIHAIENAVNGINNQSERWNSGESRRERYAANSCSGSTDAFWDDNDYVNGGLSSNRQLLDEIFAWLRTECPLLMAQYEEQKLSGQWKQVEEFV